MDSSFHELHHYAAHSVGSHWLVSAGFSAGGWIVATVNSDPVGQTVGATLTACGMAMIGVWAAKEAVVQRGVMARERNRMLLQKEWDIINKESLTHDKEDLARQLSSKTGELTQVQAAYNDLKNTVTAQASITQQLLEQVETMDLRQKQIAVAGRQNRTLVKEALAVGAANTIAISAVTPPPLSGTIDSTQL